ncbi:MAG: hypothetical protein ACD_39C00554G0004 [uncultured bacterium]|nr:MAG: hypothetical protein ACD_39C00554G0004 [uncultured bacterium]
MLQNLSSLDETADRFRRSSEFIWNLSLQFRDLIRPELGDNGLIAYSDQQRQIIGRIIKLREQGMNDVEILRSFNGPDASMITAQNASEERLQCPGAGACKNNFKILAGQVKLLWKQLRLLQGELTALQQGRSSGKDSAERIFPTSEIKSALPVIPKNFIS